MSDVIRALVEQQMRAETQYIEDCLRMVLGWRVHLPHSILARLDYQVVYQRDPAGESHRDQFRGIMHRGVLVHDEHPSWPRQGWGGPS